MTTILPSTLTFLKDLAKNNNREWFHENKKRYDEAKGDILAFTTDLLAASTEVDPTLAGLEPKKCIFRINRDIRFSKDKSPYKTNMGIFFNMGGKKAPTAGYYFNIQPGGTFVGGGIYVPESAHLKKIREEIDYNLSEFEGIIKNGGFQEYYGGLSVDEKHTLKRPPKGYDADNPAIQYLKYKSFTAIRHLDDKEVKAPAFFDQCVTGVKVLKPLVDYLNRGIE